MDKLLTEYSDLNASSVEEQQLNVSLGRFFDTGKIVWGITADGNSTERKGTENLFLNENSRNYVQIGSMEKYSHKIHHLIFKGFLQMGNDDAKSSFLPFFRVGSGKGKIQQPLSRIELSKIAYGLDYQWLKTFKSNQMFSVLLGLSTTHVYHTDAVFNNSGKPAIHEMLQDNYAFQASGFWQAKLDIHFHFSVPVVKNVFVGGKMMYSHFKHDSNSQWAVSIGSIFKLIIMKFSDVKLIMFVGGISLFCMQHTLQKHNVDYGEVAVRYKKPLQYWPKPTVDAEINWKEFEAIEWDSNYYETQELPEVILGKSCFLTQNFRHPARFPAAVAIILN